MRNPYRYFAIVVAALFGLSACKPSEPPPDIVKTQRDALNKAKAVEGQLERRAEDENKVLESADK